MSRFGCLRDFPDINHFPLKSFFKRSLTERQSVILVDKHIQFSQFPLLSQLKNRNWLSFSLLQMVYSDKGLGVGRSHIDGRPCSYLDRWGTI